MEGGTKSVAPKMSAIYGNIVNQKILQKINHNFEFNDLKFTKNVQSKHIFFNLISSFFISLICFTNLTQYTILKATLITKSLYICTLSQ